MAEAKARVTATGTWANLVATYSDLASVAAFVQNHGGGAVFVAFTASSSAPASDMGVLLNLGDMTVGTAPNIWVKVIGPGAVTIACGKAD